MYKEVLEFKIDEYENSIDNFNFALQQNVKRLEYSTTNQKELALFDFWVITENKLVKTSNLDLEMKIRDIRAATAVNSIVILDRYGDDAVQKTTDAFRGIELKCTALSMENCALSIYGNLVRNKKDFENEIGMPYTIHSANNLTCKNIPTYYVLIDKFTHSIIDVLFLDGIFAQEFLSNQYSQRMANRPHIGGISLTIPLKTALENSIMENSSIGKIGYYFWKEDKVRDLQHTQDNKILDECVKYYERQLTLIETKPLPRTSRGFKILNKKDDTWHINVGFGSKIVDIVTVNGLHGVKDYYNTQLRLMRSGNKEVIKKIRNYYYKKGD